MMAIEKRLSLPNKREIKMEKKKPVAMTPQIFMAVFQHYLNNKRLIVLPWNEGQSMSTIWND